MNPLRLLPPETAHALAIAALKRGIGPRAAKDDPCLETQLFGRTLVNPVGLAAGAEKKAEALTGWTRMGFGFVEAGTVTPKARAGNPKPRLWRLGHGHLVNWLGLPGDGIEPFVANLAAFHATPQREKLAVGASLAAPDGTADDFARMAEACAPYVDYFTLNASCPNVGHGDTDAVKTAREQVAAVVSGAGGKSVLLKLGPTRDMESLKAMAGAALKAGAAGFVATNTVPFDKKDLIGPTPFDWPQNGGKPVGGYSGPLLLDISCGMVEELRALAGPDAPVIGVGGVQGGADALRLVRAGANAVQLYTDLTYKGAGLLKDIKNALIEG